MSNDQKNEPNFGVSFLYLFSSFLAIYAVIAYIAYLFNYKLRISGADMPTLDLVGMVVCLSIAGVVYFFAHYFDNKYK